MKIDPWDQNRENIFLHGMSRDFCILFFGVQVHGTGHHRKVSAVRLFFELDLASLHHFHHFFHHFHWHFPHSRVWVTIPKEGFGMLILEVLDEICKLQERHVCKTV